MTRWYELVIWNRVSGLPGLFHDSFEDNEAQLIDALETSFRKGVLFISPVNLNGLPKIREAFEAQNAENAAHISVQEAVETITKGSWSPEHTAAMAAGPTDFYQVFNGEFSVSSP